MPERRVVAKLKATTAITALVGVRIEPGNRKQGDPLPAITIFAGTKTKSNCSAGTTASGQRQIIVDSWASTYAGVKALGLLVEDALSGWSDLTGDPQVSMCHLQGDTDGEEPMEPGQDVREHNVKQFYQLDFNTT